jgi:hypothetical protein
MRDMCRRLLLAFLFLATARLGAQPVGIEFRINTYTTNDQGVPAVAAAPDGSFVVAWQSYFQASAGSKEDIFAQRFSATGAPLGSEFRVNNTSAYNQVAPAVAVDAHGNFVVVWRSYETLIGSILVHGQRFSSSGTRLGGEFRVNTAATTSDQNYPSVAMDANGDFVVVWTLLETGSLNVHGQRFSAGGSPVGGAFRVNEDSSINNTQPRVAMDAQGRFVVTWTRGPGGGDDDVAGRRYDAGGAPVGTEFRINTYTTGIQLDPAVAMDAAGDFAVVWRSLGQDPNPTGIHGQRFAASGSPLGAELLVNDDVLVPVKHIQPSVASDPLGNFVVAWSETSYYYSGYNIAARRFTRTGDGSSQLSVNTYIPGEQAHPAVAADYDHFVVVWSSDGQDGAARGVYGQRYSPGPQGDVNGDGAVNVADVFYLINYLFAGGPPPLGPSDANGDGVLSVADIFYLINFLFAGGPAPA